MEIKHDGRSISLAGCNKTWDDVEARANQLNLDRSKYIQQLVETDITHHLLDNPQHLEYIQGNGKNKRKLIDATILFFLLAIFTLLLIGTILGGRLI